MIPSDFAERMKLIADFDSLILRHTVIEMAVQQFCRPTGAASEILTMFEESFREDRTQRPRTNGLTKHVRPELPEPVVLDKPSVEELDGLSTAEKKKLRNKYEQRRLARLRQEDPWHAPEWRKEILRFAAEHDGVFTISDYSTYYGPRHKRKLGYTRMAAVLDDMVGRQRYLKKLEKGKYAMTTAGKEAALELGASPGKPSSNGHAEDSAAAKKGRVIEDPWGQTKWRKEIFKSAAANSGRFDVNQYREGYNKTSSISIGNSRVYATLHFLRTKGLVKKVGIGRYVVTAAGQKAAIEEGIDFKTFAAHSGSKRKGGSHTRPPSKGPARPEMLEQYAAQHDGNIYTNDFIHTVKTSPGSLYTLLSNMQTAGRIEKVAKGHFRLLPVAEATASA